MKKENLNQLAKLLEAPKTVLIIQAENPDGDSVASSLALEGLLDPKHKVIMFCNVPVPIYLKFLDGTDRITQEFPHKFDLAILVDCAEELLLSKTLSLPDAILLKSKPVFVLDHHQDKINLPFDTISLIDADAPATGSLVYKLASELNLKIVASTAQCILSSIMSDTLGLSLPFVVSDDFRLVADLIDLGAEPAKLEEARKALMKRPQNITTYKGELLQRAEYLLDGVVAWINIPWVEIEKHSGIYNPPMLVMEDLKLTTGVGLVIAIKSYPRGKFTAKLRANPGYEICDKLAQSFGCGGHAGAAGIKVEAGLYTYDEFKAEILRVTKKLLDDLK